MMKYLFAVYLLIFSLSCGKAVETGCTPNPVAAEKSAMVAFANTNLINYQEHPSGILYEIINAGTGATPSRTSSVSVMYVLKSMQGVTIQASANPFTRQLDLLIEGWKIGIPLIKAGGKIKLLIPSALAYSCVGSGDIPPNSPLYFEVNLISVQ